MLGLPKSDVSIGSSAIFAGWGSTKTVSYDDEPVLSDSLRKIIIDVVDREECRKYFPIHNIPSTQICGRPNNSDENVSVVSVFLNFYTEKLFISIFTIVFLNLGKNVSL